MGLMSKIAESRIGKVAALSMGVGAAFIPTSEILNPPAVNAGTEYTHDWCVDQAKGIVDELKNYVYKGRGDGPFRFKFNDGYFPNVPDHSLKCIADKVEELAHLEGVRIKINSYSFNERDELITWTGEYSQK